ncbi:MAG: hypothetical protein M1812_004894 [Candelaria pacifica]|nr:MAG: hypothetical protein M1812_004894 [Candelaria pacifica]
MSVKLRQLATPAARKVFSSSSIGAPWISSSSIQLPRQCCAPPGTAKPTRLAISNRRLFSTSPSLLDADASHEQAAKDLNQKALDDFDSQVTDQKEKQTRTPWHREGSDVAPVSRPRSAGAMTKGKLLTTPSRLLKLILPLTTLDQNTDRKDVEPLALLVHPQQPLSYLERLIQSELPSVKNDDGKDKAPAVYFRAEDSAQEEEDMGSKDNADGELEKTNFGGRVEKTGKLNRKTPEEAKELRGGAGQGGVESYSGLGHEAKGDVERKFVRWSSSTEIGDFIRDAARGKEFAVEIEGAPNEIRVGVPSFNDRTHYLRTRLRKTSRKLSNMAGIKKECDVEAHKGAQRVALGGFGVLLGWWYVVYRLTFETDLGWDTMEPVTYLVGLSTLMGGYLWFLYHNREVSYRSAMNLTISRRQSKLYAARGFDLQNWEALIDEGNALRKEIKSVASEYDVEWDETTDEQDERVTKALKDDRDKDKASAEGKKGKTKAQRKQEDKEDEDKGDD